jgi:uncharacterized membrane protein HdeD (DUF308 family)
MVTSENKDSSSSEIMMTRYWWIFLVRGIAALLLGLTLVLQPEKSRSMMIQYIAIYLLASGILSFLWGFTVGRKAGLWTLAGSIGVIGGLAFMLLPKLGNPIEDYILAFLLGLIMLVAGLVHVFGGFRTGMDYGRVLAWESFLLGLVEIILGMMMIASPWVSIEMITITGIIWGFTAGIGLVAESLRLRKLTCQTEAGSDAL